MVGELDEKVVSSILELTTADGKIIEQNSTCAIFTHMGNDGKQVSKK